MKPTQSNAPLTRRQVVALRGLRLSRLALQQLAKCGIYCQPAVSIEYQRTRERHVILGKESGGAVKDIGAYCGFASLTGELLEWLNRTQPLAPNGVHATVVAEKLVRIQVFHNQGNYDLLITKHELVPGKRPTLHSRILFHGAGGTLPQLLGRPDQAHMLEIMPEFRSRSGDPMPVPTMYLEAARAALAGARCLGCRSPHLLVPHHGTVTSCGGRLAD